MNRAAFDPGRFDISYDELVNCYQIHITDLFDAYAHFKKLVKPYSSANSSLQISKAQKISLPPALLKGSLIDIKRKNPEILAALSFANIGAGCHMLDNRTVPINGFNRDYAAQLAQTIMDETISALGKNAHRNFVGDNHIADTTRIIRFLQITGLLMLDRDKSHQLSLGAFNGIRDLNAVHSNQSIHFDSTGGKQARFNSHLHRARHTVLIDPSDDLNILYNRLNNESPDYVLALIETADAGLAIVSEKIASQKIQPRNLVISMRIDHRMIYDADDFLRRLQPTISDTADLIMSFGAGDTPEDFLGRIDAFDRLEKALNNRGMSPIRIRMYNSSGKTINDYRESPYFGLYQFASHEAFYCKLVKNNMS